MSNEKLRVGFIGAGEISILHAIALHEIPNAELVGLWNRTPERAIKRAQEEQCQRYETAEALVNDPAIDAVIINTNQETHLKYARLVMEAGKHVLVEKPLAITVAEVEEMKAIAEKTGVLCVPGHNMIHGGEPLSSLDDAIWCQKTTEALEQSIADGMTVAIR